MNGPKGDLAIGRCLLNKHVMQRKVVANGIVKEEKDNRRGGALASETSPLLFPVGKSASGLTHCTQHRLSGVSASLPDRHAAESPTSAINPSIQGLRLRPFLRLVLGKHQLRKRSETVKQ